MEKPILGLRRKMLANVVLGLFPREMNPESNSLHRVKYLVEEGYGVVLVYNHFSKSDHLRAMAALLKEVRSLSGKRILSPIAFHQNNAPAKLLKRLSKIELKPIVTKDTKEEVERKKKDIPLPTKEEAYANYQEYQQTAREVLREGGVVTVAPQAGRRSTLGEPPGRPIGRLLDDYENKKIVFVFAGLGRNHVVDYGAKDIKGYAVRKPLTIKFGFPLTRWELMQLADENPRKVDHVIFSELRKVVPPEYL